MKREIRRNDPASEKVELVEDLPERGVMAEGRRVSRQPGRCCDMGCAEPLPEATRAGPDAAA